MTRLHNEPWHIQAQEEHENTYMDDVDVIKAGKTGDLILGMRLSNAQIQRLNYPVVVQMWDKRDSFGHFRREWLATFDDKERKKAGKWYRKFRSWYLYTGAPQTVTMSVATYNFLIRLINFFATV